MHRVIDRFIGPLSLRNWCQWHSRGQWHREVTDSAKSLTPRCHWLHGVTDSTVSLTPWCHWLHSVTDLTVSLIPQCHWLNGVTDSTVSLTPQCHWLHGVTDSIVSLTPRCHWHHGVSAMLKSVMSFTTVSLWDQEGQRTWCVDLWAEIFLKCFRFVKEILHNFRVKSASKKWYI